jgi:hypothetical protein
MSQAKEKLQLPCLSPLPKRHWWVLNEDWGFDEFVIPVGFVTDLDTVPHVPILFALYKGHARWSALGHDYLYSITTVSRKQADDWFLDAMLEEGVPSWIAKSMYWAVRACGWTRYNKERKHPKDTRLQRRLADHTGCAAVFQA